MECPLTRVLGNGRSPDQGPMWWRFSLPRARVVERLLTKCVACPQQTWVEQEQHSNNGWAWHACPAESRGPLRNRPSHSDSQLPGLQRAGAGGGCGSPIVKVRFPGHRFHTVILHPRGFREQGLFSERPVTLGHFHVQGLALKHPSHSEKFQHVGLCGLVSGLV